MEGGAGSFESVTSHAVRSLLLFKNEKSQLFTHFFPYSTRGTVRQPRPGHFCWRTCKRPDHTSHKWSQSRPGSIRGNRSNQCKLQYRTQQSGDPRKSLSLCLLKAVLTLVHIKQHSANRTTRAQCCFERTPPRQTCVSLLQDVKFSLGSEVGQRAVTPLHMPSMAHSESRLQLSLAPLKVHCSVQHGPWLGLEGRERIKGQAPIQCHLLQTPNRKGGNVTSDLHSLPGCSLHFLSSASLAL